MAEEGNTPTEPVAKTATVDDLYLKEVYHEFDVRGVHFKIRDVGSDELLEATQNATVNGDVNQKLYAKALMKLVIVEPKLDFTKELSASVSTAILVEIEDFLGLSELAQKKLLKRWS